MNPDNSDIYVSKVTNTDFIFNQEKELLNPCKSCIYFDMKDMEHAFTAPKGKVYMWNRRNS